jgi:hypothetical protein
MFPFTFFHGLSFIPSQPLPPMLGRGLVNDYHENGINTLGYEPYYMERGNMVFQSDICHRSYMEWRHLIDNNPGDVTYYLYAVLRPDEDYREQELIDLHGATDVFPLFVLENPHVEFLFEFIMIPNVHI